MREAYRSFKTVGRARVFRCATTVRRCGWRVVGVGVCGAQGTRVSQCDQAGRCGFFCNAHIPLCFFAGGVCRFIHSLAISLVMEEGSAGRRDGWGWRSWLRAPAASPKRQKSGAHAHMHTRGQGYEEGVTYAVRNFRESAPSRVGSGSWIQVFFFLPSFPLFCDSFQPLKCRLNSMYYSSKWLSPSATTTYEGRATLNCF